MRKAIKENREMDSIEISYPGQIVQFLGLPYIVMRITTDYDPYLVYCRHFRAYCPINGREIGGALADSPNPYCDISGVVNGTKHSAYV